MLKPFDLQALSIFLCIKVALVTEPAGGTGQVHGQVQQPLHHGGWLQEAENGQICEADRAVYPAAAGRGQGSAGMEQCGLADAISDDHDAGGVQAAAVKEGTAMEGSGDVCFSRRVERHAAAERHQGRPGPCHGL